MCKRLKNVVWMKLAFIVYQGELKFIVSCWRGGKVHESAKQLRKNLVYFKGRKGKKIVT